MPPYTYRQKASIVPNDKLRLITLPQSIETTDSLTGMAYICLTPPRWDKLK